MYAIILALCYYHVHVYLSFVQHEYSNPLENYGQFILNDLDWTILGSLKLNLVSN